MPWTGQDASKKTKKANTPKKQSLWVEIANRILGKTGDEGKAIRDANKAVAGVGNAKPKQAPGFGPAKSIGPFSGLLKKAEDTAKGEKKR